MSDGLHFELLAVADPASTVAGTGGATGAEPSTVEGSGIRLRPWRHTDAQRVAEACRNELTPYWLAGSLPRPYTLDNAHSYINACQERTRHGTGVFWCVADADTDQCLGAVGVDHLQDALGTAGEIGYWTHPDARGHGVMSEAVRLCVRHAFIGRQDGGLGRARLRLNAAAGNAVSQHLARVNGFAEVGRDRRAEPPGDGTFADLVRFDLLVEEWNATG